jgi:hypothetical protein
MPSALFDPGREGFLGGEIDWDTATIRAALVRAYTFSAAHRFVSDLTTAGGVLHANVALGTKTITAGVADAADSVFTTPAANASGHIIVIYQSSAVTGGADVAATAQRLIAHIDTYTGLPVTPNGADITVAWPNDANRIFKL